MQMTPEQFNAALVKYSALVIKLTYTSSKDASFDGALKACADAELALAKAYAAAFENAHAS